MNRSLPALALLLAWSAASAEVPVPPRYAPVLEAHGLKAEDLPERGFAFVNGECLPVDKSGGPTGPALTPAQLHLALARRSEDGVQAPETPVTAPAPEIPDLSETRDAVRDLDRLYDGARGGAAPPPAAGGPPGDDAGTPAPPRFEEPAFDPSWAPIERRLRGKRPHEGVRALAARFQPAETETGLTPEAPEALRLLATAILERRGGEAAIRELDRQLKTVAFLSLEEKSAFARQLRSPLPVYAALGVSHMAHYSDAGLYFARMKELLKDSGASLPEYIRQADPRARHSQKFLLRLNVYDLLMPHVSRHPEQGADSAAMLFPAGRLDLVRARALQLQGVAAQMPAYSGPRAAKSFVEAARGLALSQEDVALQAALLLALNAPHWPVSLQAAANGAAVGLPPGLLEDPRLKPPAPDLGWPEGDVRIRMHFPLAINYRLWLDFFTRHGYTVVETSTEGVTVSKSGAARDIRMTATLYGGDEEGYLKDDEKRKFLAAVARDLKDPGVQGVVVRTHAQFHYPALFRGKVSEGKFWLDGSCRGAWYQEELSRRCPTCKPVTNTGTGMSEITNPVLYEILGGISDGEDWQEIHGRLKRRLPKAHTRLVGPWSPRYDKALDLLKKASAPSSRAPRAGPTPASSSR